MGLPLQWVERIFDRLTTTYGQEFTGKYNGVNVNDVKAAWSHELGGFEQSPEAIAHVLGNLTAKAPNLIEFRNMCLAAPRKQADRIESPKANPERVAAELAKLNIAKQSVSRVDHKAWARVHIARHEAGERVRPIAMQYAREALKATA